MPAAVGRSLPILATRTVVPVIHVATIIRSKGGLSHAARVANVRKNGGWLFDDLDRRRSCSGTVRKRAESVGPCTCDQDREAIYVLANPKPTGFAPLGRAVFRPEPRSLRRRRADHEARLDGAGAYLRDRITGANPKSTPWVVAQTRSLPAASLGTTTGPLPDQTRLRDASRYWLGPS
jgi:hypothetical protein